MSLVNTFAAWGVSQTLAAQVSAILRKYGTDAHVYLPGIGVINGLTAGNYLDSAGTTPATVDNPVGLVVDANGAINATQATTANKPILRRGAVNLIIRSQEFNIGSWTKNNVAAVDGIVAAPIGTSQASTLTTIAGTNAHTITSSAISCPSGAAISIYAKANTHSLVQLFIGGTATPYANFNLANGTASGFGAGTTASIENAGDGWYRCILKTTNTAASSFQFGLVTNISSARAESWNAVGTESVYIFGAQAENGSTVSPYIPTTTAPASSSTGNYHWVHDSTDLLTATFPAGYESATTINAATTGQTTLTAQNIVGAYNIGPSIDTYGRFVFRTDLTASELAIIQTYCNRLAGL